ncbi:MAG TPA: hypothetical protein VFP84_38620 [Kofleriaceae bacterium]|nr:hypothetical protein [Kofleriaceae bacterium]
MTPSQAPQGDPAIEGADYVALVIEWDNDNDLTFVGLVDNGPEAPASVADVPGRTPPIARTIATVVGALGVLALATWGLRRLIA